MTTLRYIIVAFAVAVIIAVLGYIVGHETATREMQPVKVEHDTVVVVDTMRVILPPDTVTRTEIKKVYVHDTEVIVQNDSVFVLLPYEQHHMSVKDTLDLWYSGIDARVDSLKFYPRNTFIKETVTLKGSDYRNTIGLMAGFDDVSVLYMRRFGKVSLGLSAGYTYDRHATARGFVGINF